MNLTVKEITLGDQTVSLRLTTKPICTYVMKHGTKDAPPITAVMVAVDNITAKCDLLTGALCFPGNENKIRTGEDLLDHLADAGYTPDEVNGLIIELAAQAGLCGLEDCRRLTEASKVNSSGIVEKLVGLLNGTLDLTAGVPAESHETTEGDKTPT